jgi:hypothetical protein
MASSEDKQALAQQALPLRPFARLTSDAPFRTSLNTRADLLVQDIMEDDASRSVVNLADYRERRTIYHPSMEEMAEMNRI